MPTEVKIRFLETITHVSSGGRMIFKKGTIEDAILSEDGSKVIIDWGCGQRIKIWLLGAVEILSPLQQLAAEAE